MSNGEWSHVSLREFIEEKIAADRERNNILFTERMRALEIQAREYERRLDALNGEAGRIRDIQATYVPRETYENYVKEQAAAARILSTQVEQTKTTLEKQVESVRTTLENAAKETTDRIEVQVKELRDLQQASGGQRAGAEGAQARFLAVAAGLIAFAAIVINLVH